MSSFPLPYLFYDERFDETDVYACEADYTVASHVAGAFLRSVVGVTAFNRRCVHADFLLPTELYSVLTLIAGISIYTSLAVKYHRCLHLGWRPAVLYLALASASLAAGALHATQATPFGPSVHTSITVSYAALADTVLVAMLPAGAPLLSGRVAAAAAAGFAFWASYPLGFLSKTTFLPFVLGVSALCGVATIPCLLKLALTDFMSSYENRRGVFWLFVFGGVYIPLHVAAFFFGRSTEPHCDTARWLGVEEVVHAVEHLGDLCINHLLITSALLVHIERVTPRRRPRIDWRLCGMLPVLVLDNPPGSVVRAK